MSPFAFVRIIPNKDGTFYSQLVDEKGFSKGHADLSFFQSDNFSTSDEAYSVAVEYAKENEIEIIGDFPEDEFEQMLANQDSDDNSEENEEKLSD